MKRKHVFMILCLAGLMACRGDREPEGVAAPPAVTPEEPAVEEPVVDLPYVRRVDIDLSDAEKLVARQSRVFAFDFLQTVYEKEEEGENIFISPLSLNLALLMLNNGAAGETRRELEEVLVRGLVPGETLNAYAGKLVKAMQELDPRAAFESANSIWIRNTFPVLEAFKEVNRQYFEAEVREEDFAAPATLGLINGWVEEKTHGRITEILSAVDPAAMLYLIHTLYFKGYWEEPFKKESTEDKTFFNQDGSEAVLPAMHATRELGVCRNGRFSALELPYGNGAFGMVVVLPNEGVSLDAVVESFDADAWDQYLADPAQTYDVSLQLPTFKVEYRRTLNDDLIAMGLPSMFGPADLSPINQDAGLFVSAVLQKTFVEVNERGTEAAAATVIGLQGLGIGDTPPPLDFHVNRPFLFFIKEKSTGLPFFAGVVRNL
jgi:serpin B